MKLLAVIISSLLLSACQLSIIRPDYAPVEEAVSYVVPPKQEQLGIDVVPTPPTPVKPKPEVKTKSGQLLLLFQNQITAIAYCEIDHTISS